MSDFGQKDALTPTYLALKVDAMTPLRRGKMALIPLFTKWVREQRDFGQRLICVEGLPDAGKSNLVRSVGEEFVLIHLDEFLPNPIDETKTWVEQVLESAALQELQKALGGRNTVLMEGIACRPIVDRILVQPNIVWVYIKRMEIFEGENNWTQGDDLVEEFVAPLELSRSTYIESLEAYHRENEPWRSADLVIENLFSD